MNVKVLRYANMKKNIFEKGFKFFLEILKKIDVYTRKVSANFFWQFFTPPGYLGRCGKMPNHLKIAPGGLGLSLCDFFLKSGFCQIDVFTKYRCCNTSKWPQMPQK